MRTYYRRHLPHIMPIGATFFMTWRLFGSIPPHIMKQIDEERQEGLRQLESDIRRLNLSPEEINKRKYMLEHQHFHRFDEALDSAGEETPHHLRDPKMADIVVESMRAYDKKWYNLLAYCIMSNHVHALLDFSVQLPMDRLAPLDESKYVQLDTVMKHIKGTSAANINYKCHRTGAFWQPESYDRYIRNEKHLAQAIEYTYLNPVKAGLCKDWRAYPYTFVK